MAIKNTPLSKIAEENEIILVADIDHENEAISRTLTEQLAGIHTQGIKHLYLERYPTEYSPSDLRADPTPFGDLVREADRLGIQVHMYDDNSKKHVRDAQFPAEAAFADEHDFYRKDIDAIINKAPDPVRMKQYLDMETDAYKLDPLDIADRNPRMIENISREMAQHPGEKALVFGGSWHTDKSNDLDEGLRISGHQVVTVELNPPDSNSAIWRSDRPDFTIYSENASKVTLLKYLQTGLIQTADGEITSWKNTESANSPLAPSLTPAKPYTASDLTLAAANDFKMMNSYKAVVANLPADAPKQSYLQEIKNHPEFQAALVARFNTIQQLATEERPQVAIGYIQDQFDANVREMIISSKYQEWANDPTWTPITEDWHSYKQEIQIGAAN
jgi:hypothetical protein